MNRTFPVMLAFCLAAVMAVAPIPAFPTAVAAQGALPEGEGKDVTEALCSSCHSAGSLTEKQRSVPEWDGVLTSMESFGAFASKEDWEKIRRYIYSQLATIEVNKSDASVLQVTMGVDEEVAAAIVAYRMANGNFQTLDDLKKVQGIDAAKVDALKDRVTF